MTTTAPPAGRRRSVVRALFLAMLGTGLVMGLVFPLVVAPFADYRPGMRLAFSALCLAAGLVVGAVNFLLVRAFLLRTIDRVSTQIEALSRGEGMVASRLALDSDDTLGLLVARFNALIDRLQGSLHRVTDTVGAFLAHADETGTTARELARSAERKSQVVDGTAVLFEGLHGELKALRTAMDQLRDAAGGTAAAVTRQVEQAEAVNAQLDQLQRRSQVNTEGISRSGAALQRSVAGTGHLTRALDEAAAAMTAVDLALGRIEQGLRDTAAVAEVTAADAGEGDEAVRSTQRAMERVRDGVDAAADGIRSFTRQAAAIATVTDVIDEVTDQTGLLALNAAIIAAQAGSHGAGFAVVAGQIKKLAERTASSTHEIGDLLRDFRSQADAALAAMTGSQGLVEDGVRLSLRASEALGRIRAGAGASHEHVTAISAEVLDAAAGAHQLSRTVAEIAGRARDIAAATREQEAGLSTLGGSAHETREVADAIAGAVQRQLEAARDIRRQTDRAGELFAGSREAIDALGGQTELLATTIETLRELDARERDSFGRCERDTERLSRQGESVRREIERLTPQGGEGRLPEERRAD